jgi:hypothetical protein
MYHRTDDIRHTRLRPQVHKVRHVAVGQRRRLQQHIAAVRPGHAAWLRRKGHGHARSFRRDAATVQPWATAFFFKTMVASPAYGVSTKRSRR